MKQKPGLLIVGHGTRDARGVDGFLGITRMVEEMMPDWVVQPCFLDHARPSIPEGVQRLADRGVEEVRVMPFLLLAGGHVRRDIPASVSASVAQHPGIRVQHSHHLGSHTKVLEVSARRYQEALAGQPEVPEHQTVLVLVGHGARDPRAVQEMLAFSELRASSPGFGWVVTCFLTMSEPRFADTLLRVSRLPAKRIVVQPHLLLTGGIGARVDRQVERFRGAYPGLEWIVTGPLGVDRGLAEAVRHRVTACQSQDRTGPVSVA